jgi:hypothetical protein
LYNFVQFGGHFIGVLLDLLRCQNGWTIRDTFSVKPHFSTTTDTPSRPRFDQKSEMSHPPKATMLKTEPIETRA